jgi:holo-[acyl-carrier protein] synthase
MGITWQDMHIVNLSTGKPTLKIEGKAKVILKKILPKGFIANVQVSLTDDYPWAKAIVIIEAV